MSRIFVNGCIAALVALLTGCTDRSETGSESMGASTTEDVPTTTAPTEDGSSGDQPPERFGFTCVQFRRGESVNIDPFAGTREVQITLNYAPCLIDYYMNRHPEMQLSGPAGAEVFAAWKPRLCTEDIAGRADCEVESFEQQLDHDLQTYNLSITYVVPPGAEISGHSLLWGPGPLPEFAECMAGLKPWAALSSLVGVVGRNENDQVIWQVQSYTDSPGLMGLTGETCIKVAIEPT